jgi:hypothetical protein
VVALAAGTAFTVPCFHSTVDASEATTASVESVRTRKVELVVAVRPVVHSWAAAVE